ncbi:MAG TPA: NAD-dependent epimerase/dehydratase family protein, partial [Flavisolibacter sp.]|nr:NAD-dependent epimerase/dehydratase family protein [Flavisolibacter sp.]
METILITGGTGLIGTALTKSLVENGYNVIILTRKSTKGEQLQVKYAQWNIEEQYIDEQAIKEADHIIHLAGANVAEGRWTDKRKRE